MKKWMMIIGSLVVAVVVATMATGAVLARGRPDNGGMMVAGAARGCVDADGDGVRDLDGSGYGNAYGFVDANGDGINDRYVDGGGVPALDGTGYGFGHGFVDANGDGVDDRYAQGNGQHQPRRHGIRVRSRVRVRR